MNDSAEGIANLINCFVWCCLDRHIIDQDALFSVVVLSSSVSATGKERSRIARYGRDLCGTIAMGEIFSSCGGLSLMASHCTRGHAFLARIFSATSSLSYLIASGTRADMCGPFVIAVAIIAGVYGFPVLTRQPLDAYSKSVAAAG